MLPCFWRYYKVIASGKNQKIKVLFIIWSLERGGAERFLAGLLTHIDLDRFAPTLCCLNWPGEWANTVEHRNIPVIALHKKNGFDGRAWYQLYRLIRTGKFDIVNTHLWAADLMGRVAAIVAGVPVIITTAQNVDVWKTPMARRIDRILSWRTNQLIAVSEAVRDFYATEIGFPAARITVIANAIDVRRFQLEDDAGQAVRREFGIQADDVVFACVGRLTEQKGQRYLLAAMAMLRQSHPRLVLLLVGEGEDRRELEALANEYGLRDRIHFTGQRQDIPQILAAAQALVLPSIFEGLPLCVLEALASARPVIATDVGGTREIFNDGEAGFILKPRDISALAAALTWIYEHPTEAAQMGRNGQRIVYEHFSIDSATRRTEEVFTQCLAARLKKQS